MSDRGYQFLQCQHTSFVSLLRRLYFSFEEEFEAARRLPKHQETFVAEPAKVRSTCIGPAQRDFVKPVVNEATTLGIQAVQTINDYMNVKKPQEMRKI